MERSEIRGMAGVPHSAALGAGYDDAEPVELPQGIV
jgi:hypothetical protein